MERRINIACFEPGSKVAKVDDIWQWDYGQILRIQGLNLPTAVEIHFSLDEQNGEAVRRIGITQDGVTDVVIPDSMVENESAYGDSYYFFAYIYLTDETSGNTEYKIRAKVTTRSKPEGYNSGDSTFAAILKTVNEIADDKVTRPETAKVGQVLSVKATDEEGKPTEFEATDPGGGVSDEKIAEAVGTYMEAHPIEETDPTVPQWAKQPEKPTYTASEVGADAAGTAESKVSEHNTATDAHNDIRLLVQGLTDKLNAFADSDDETLDQASEFVAYIKANRSLIESITTSKVSVADIIDNLTTSVSNKPLSAAQGVALKNLIDAIIIPSTLPNPKPLTFTGAATGRYDGSEEVSVNIPSGVGGGVENAKYYNEIILEEDVSTVEVSVSEFSHCNVIFIQIYIGTITINDNTSVNRIVRYKFDTKGGAWSSGCVINTHELKNGVSEAYIGSSLIVINESNMYYCMSSNRRKYDGASFLGINSATFGQYVTITDNTALVFEIYNRTYNIPSGTVIRIIGF